MYLAELEATITSKPWYGYASDWNKLSKSEQEKLLATRPVYVAVAPGKWQDMKTKKIYSDKPLLVSKKLWDSYTSDEKKFYLSRRPVFVHLGGERWQKITGGLSDFFSWISGTVKDIFSGVVEGTKSWVQQQASQYIGTPPPPPEVKVEIEKPDYTPYFIVGGIILGTLLLVRKR